MQKADEQTRSDVLDAISKLFDAYTRRDVNAFLEGIAPDVVAFGSGQDQILTGKEAIRENMERDWAQSTAASVDFEPITVHATGSCAFVAGRCTFHVDAYGRPLTVSGRMTMALEHASGKWRVVQYHFSVPAATQSPGEAFPMQPAMATR